MKFTPVIMGANRGSYGLARAFYEEYGVKSALISPYRTGSVKHSKIINYYKQLQMTDIESMLETMVAIEIQEPETKKIIFGSDDRYVSFLIENRMLFGPNWLVPYPDEQTYEAVTDKTLFYELCEQLDVAYPRTVVLDRTSTFDLTYPVIIKAAQTPEYQNLDFEGKKKVYLCQTQEEAWQNIALIRQAGYTAALIVQEYIPGDDTSLGIVTAYVAKKDGQIKLISYANVLVDDPTPSAIGNSLAGFVREEESIKEPIQRIVEASGFYGFMTFDVKYDARRCEYIFFEVNGRLGLSNYYVTAAGHNVAWYYIEDFLLENNLSMATFQKEIVYSNLTNHLLCHNLHIPQSDNKKPMVHPLVAPYEKSWRRKLYILISSINYYRKLWKHASLENIVIKKANSLPKTKQVVNNQTLPLK